MASQSLNSDPYNLRSEELAMAECARGVELRRVWSEQEMVCSFGGHMFPGTPDGMFESWDGELTCVQVVRVPLVPGMGPDRTQETLAHTILTKVVKSQKWLRACRAVPHDFVIFCWLPFTVPADVVEAVEDLMQRVRKLDPRFSLKLRVPPQPGDLFPARFAYVHSARSQKRDVQESDISTYLGGDEDSEEEEEMPWDITWSWELDPQEVRAESPEGPTSGQDGGSDAEEGVEAEDVEAGSAAATEEDAEVAWEVASFSTDSEVDVGKADICPWQMPRPRRPQPCYSAIRDPGCYQLSASSRLLWDDGG